MEQRLRIHLAQILQQKDDAIHALQEAIAERDGYVRILTESLQQAEMEKESLRDKVVQLNSSIDNQRKRHAQSRTMTHAQLKRKIAALQGRLLHMEESAACSQNKEGRLQEQMAQMTKGFLREREEWTRRNEELRTGLIEQREKLEAAGRESLALKTEVTQLSNQCWNYMALLRDDKLTTVRLREALAQCKRKVQELKRDMERTKQEMRRAILACHERTHQIVSQCMTRMLTLSLRNRQLEASRREAEMRIRQLQIANRELSRGSRYAVSNSFWLTVH